MTFILGLIVVLLLAFYTAKSRNKNGILGFIIALLYFPIGVILALAKKYK